LIVKGKEISTFRNFFDENVGEVDQPFAIWGSAGFLEIAVNGRSAAQILGVKRGDPVETRN
jgi:S-adenosylmethionine hydrolase